MAANFSSYTLYVINLLEKLMPAKKLQLENPHTGNSDNLIVNAKKHQALIFGQTDHKFSFLVKYELDIFGMTIDNRLNFDSHISTVFNKVNNQFNVMLRFRNVISKDKMLKSYKAFILPHFYYCSSVWHFCGTRNSEKLETVNKCILRFILNDCTSHYTTLLNKVEMNSLYNKSIQNFLILVYKSLFFNEYTTYLRNMFTVRHTTYNLHSTHMSTLSKPRKTTYGLHSFSYFSAQQWNDLPDKLRTVLLMILSNVCKV